jgi:hypothetical protein
VSPKVASKLMGHGTPEYQPAAAAITLGRYTHTLPGELERAGDLLDAFNAQRARSELTRSFLSPLHSPDCAGPLAKRDCTAHQPVFKIGKAW